MIELPTGRLGRLAARKKRRSEKWPEVLQSQRLQPIPDGSLPSKKLLIGRIVVVGHVEVTSKDDAVSPRNGVPYERGEIRDDAVGGSVGISNAKVRRCGWVRTEPASVGRDNDERLSTGIPRTYTSRRDCSYSAYGDFIFLDQANLADLLEPIDLDAIGEADDHRPAFEEVRPATFVPVGVPDVRVEVVDWSQLNMSCDVRRRFACLLQEGNVDSRHGHQLTPGLSHLRDVPADESD